MEVGVPSSVTKSPLLESLLNLKLMSTKKSLDILGQTV